MDDCCNGRLLQSAVPTGTVGTMSRWAAIAAANNAAQCAAVWQTIVSNAAAFTCWESAWRGPNGPPDVLRVGLIAANSVTVLAAHVDDRIVGGAVLHRSAGVVGISNFFDDSGDRSKAWHDCLSFVGTLFPVEAIVGYDQVDNLGVLRSHGFEAVGALRVWTTDP